MATGQEGNNRLTPDTGDLPPGYVSVIHRPDGSLEIHSYDPKGPWKLTRNAQGGFKHELPDGKIEYYTTDDRTDHTKGGHTKTTEENSHNWNCGHDTDQCGGGKHGESPGDAGHQHTGHVAISVHGRANIRCQQGYLGCDTALNINAPTINMKGSTLNIAMSSAINADGGVISLNGGQGTAGASGGTATV